MNYPSLQVAQEKNKLLILEKRDMKKMLMLIFFVTSIFLAISISKKLLFNNGLDSAEEFIVTGARVHILEQPSVKSKKIGLLRFGQTLYKPERKYDSEGNIWYRVLCNENCYEKYSVDKNRYMNHGWVRGNYLYPYNEKKSDIIILKICKNKFSSSVEFGDLVELKNFIDDEIQNISDVKITSELLELGYNVLEKSLQLIDDNKKYISPYKECIEKYRSEYKQTDKSSSTYGANSPIVSNVKGE